MSDSNLPRVPFTVEGNPQEEGNDEILVRLEEIFGPETEIHQLGPKPGYYYTGRPISNGLRLFLKVESITFVERIWQSDKIARFLHSRGQTVPVVLSELSRPFAEDSFLFVYEYFPSVGRNYSATEAEQMGEVLGLTHNHLRDLPAADEVKRRCEQREDWIRDVLGEVQNGSIRDFPYYEEIREVIEGRNICYGEFDQPSQVIHGDLNPGNWLFSQSKSPVLLDFENSTFSYFPPIFDLGFALERLFLWNQPEARKHISEFLSGYCGCGDETRLPDLQSVEGILKILHTRALCLLIAMATSGGVVDNREWGKFLELELRLPDHIEMLRPFLS